MGLPVRITRWVFAAAALALFGAAPRLVRAADPNVELGPDVGILRRPAASGRGARYGTGFAYGAHVQVPVASFIRTTAYYVRTSQSLEIDPGTLGAGAPVIARDDLASYVIGLRIQPTFSPTDRLHLWLNLGVAWGVMTSPVLHVAAPTPFEVGRHGDAFVEFPLGVGGEFDWWPHRAGVTLDLAAGAVSGGFDSATRLYTIDAAGKLVSVPLLPPFASTWSAMLGIVAHL